MTNKEIREKIIPDTAPHMGFILDKDLDLLQNETRKDERERVIGEIEKWAGENILEVGVARGADLKVVSLFRFKDKLRGLK